MSERMAELSEWLMPLQKIPTFDETQIPTLVACLKQYNEEVTDLPKGLVTVMRILHSLAIAPQSQENDRKSLNHTANICLSM